MGFSIVLVGEKYSDGLYRDRERAEYMLGWYRAAYPSRRFEIVDGDRNWPLISARFGYLVEDEAAATEYDKRHGQFE